MEAPPSENPGLTSNEIKLKRFRPIWRILLISNLALGAYMFAQPRGKHAGGRKAAKHDVKVETETEIETETETPSPPPPPAVLKVKEPITEDKQRELFQWMLEEKRKVKPTNNEEKKHINEEKAILKQFIHAESLPTL